MSSGDGIRRVSERAPSRLSVSGVVLAAGASMRFAAAGEESPGVAKQLLPFGGESLVRRTVRTARRSGLGQLIVVVGFQAADVTAELAHLAVHLVSNPKFREGQSTSVKAGLGAVDSGAAAVMFIPCDQPFMTSDLIDGLLGAYRRTGGPIVVPAFAGRRGSPVLFDRSLFEELASIGGDAGGRQLFAARADEIVEVILDEQRPLLDIDTPESYRKLLRELP